MERNLLKCKIEFEIDESGDLSAEAIDFKDEYPIIEDLMNLDATYLEDDVVYKTGRKYTADLEIEFFKSWTDWGYEYDSQMTLENICLKPL